MTTLSKNRIMIAPTFPKHIADLLEEEAKFTDLPLTTLIRRIIKWHAGKAEGRYSKAPKATIPKKLTNEEVKKSFLVDKADAKHLDKICKRTGLPRVGVIAMLVFAWFDLDPTPKID